MSLRVELNDPHRAHEDAAPFGKSVEDHHDQNRTDARSSSREPSQDSVFSTDFPKHNDRHGRQDSNLHRGDLEFPMLAVDTTSI